MLFNQATYWTARFNPALDEWKKRDKKNTQELFAEEIGVGVNMISRYRSGTIPRKDTLKEICRVLGVPETYFNPEFASREDRIYTEPGQQKAVEERRAYAREIGLSESLLMFIMENPHALEGLDFVYDDMIDNPEDAPKIDSPYQMTIADGKHVLLPEYIMVRLRSYQDEILEVLRYMIEHHWNCEIQGEGAVELLKQIAITDQLRRKYGNGKY